ncbi:hypothetical protein RB623_29320 [Mesorhizobium sp. LHD-90]|uniref:hypothetical protein n=1 Tax=Mesorhizobium sp. LHD-90 TaxID=3071414 RepID=UPI0027E1D8FA|nr:hypothetical protein [Mesorhizobium sp. LHD-90]MDQ6438174.1 hypothetical protein [Mesorhizobium sp. LHD-90]
MKRASTLPDNLEPFGVNREQAAALIGVGTTTFDVMVVDGRMPQPRMPSRERYVWDVEEMRQAFRRLPHRHGAVDTKTSNSNPWDRGTQSHRVFQ